MKKTNRCIRWLGLFSLILILPQCDFNIFPAFMPNVVSVENLSGFIPSGTTSFSLQTVTLTGMDYILLVKYYPTGSRGLVMLDQSLNVVLDRDSAGFGMACVPLATANYYAILCGVNIIYKNGVIWSVLDGSAGDYPYRDRVVVADGADYTYFRTMDNVSFTNMESAAFTATEDSGHVSFDAGGVLINNHQIGTSANRWYTIETARTAPVIPSNHITAVFRDNLGAGFIFYNLTASFYAAIIPESMLSQVPGYIVPGSSYITNGNYPYILGTNGVMNRYKMWGASWGPEDAQNGSQYRGYCIAFAQSYMYLFNTQTHTMTRAKFPWGGQSEY